jgi:hypothetical protein
MLLLRLQVTNNPKSSQVYLMEASGGVVVVDVDVVVAGIEGRLSVKDESHASNDPRTLKKKMRRVEERA